MQKLVNEQQETAATRTDTAGVPEGGRREEGNSVGCIGLSRKASTCYQQILFVPMDVITWADLGVM